MTPEQFDLRLTALRDRSPFHPFTVELVGSHSFEVDRADALIVRDGVAVFLRPGGAPEWFDFESLTRLGDVAEGS